MVDDDFYYNPAIIGRNLLIAARNSRMKKCAGTHNSINGNKSSVICCVSFLLLKKKRSTIDRLKKTFSQLALDQYLKP